MGPLIFELSPGLSRARPCAKILDRATDTLPLDYKRATPATQTSHISTTPLLTPIDTPEEGGALPLFSFRRERAGARRRTAARGSRSPTCSLPLTPSIFLLLASRASPASFPCTGQRSRPRSGAAVRTGRNSGTVRCRSRLTLPRLRHRSFCSLSPCLPFLLSRSP